MKLTTNNIRTTALLLSLLTLLPSAIACADSNPNTADTTAAHTQPVENETIDPNDRTQIQDSLPENLDFGGRTFGIYCAGEDRNLSYFGGPEKQTGEIVDDAVFNRNAAVEERLNIDIRSDGFAVDGSGIAGEVRKLVMAGDTTYDLFLGQQYGMAQVVTDNLFYNTYALQHLDFTQPWWNNSYMDELSLGSNNRFFLVGDYFIDALGYTCTIFFNKKLYAQYFDDADTLYGEVLDGKWTLDRMAEFSRAVFVDIDNNGESNPGDQLGYATYLTYSSTDPFVYATDIPFIERDAEGFVSLSLINDDAVTLAEKLVGFFYQDGSRAEYDDGDEPTVAFCEGKVLFLGNSELSSAKALRDMEDDFGFLPYPKFDAEQTDYHSLVHDAVLIGAVSNASANLDMVGACLEALSSETYRFVTPAWYETALKIKYSRDNLSTQMIDLIHDSMTTNFIYAYNYAINGVGLIYRDLVTENKTDYVSRVTKKEKAANKKLQSLLEAFTENTDA